MSTIAEFMELVGTAWRHTRFPFLAFTICDTVRAKAYNGLEGSSWNCIFEDQIIVRWAGSKQCRAVPASALRLYERVDLLSSRRYPCFDCEKEPAEDCENCGGKGYVESSEENERAVEGDRAYEREKERER